MNSFHSFIQSDNLNQSYYEIIFTIIRINLLRFS